MSRSYRKNIACHICTGSNHNYYLKRRRKYRRKLNQEIRTLISNHHIDEFDEKYVGKAGLRPFENQWDEPTDGHWGMNKSQYRKYKKEYPYIENYYDKDVKRYLKPKH